MNLRNWMTSAFDLSKSRRRPQRRTSQQPAIAAAGFTAGEALEARSLLTATSIHPDLDTGNRFEQVLEQTSPQALENGLKQIVGMLEQSLADSLEEVGSIPLIGDQASEALAPMFEGLADAADSVTEQFRQTLDQADPDDSQLKVYQNAWFNVFGPDGLNLLRSRADVTGTTVADVQTTIGEDLNTAGEVIPSTEWIQWDVHLGQRLSVDLAFDFGFDVASAIDLNDNQLKDFGLHIDGDNGVRFEFEWNLQLGFGFSVVDDSFFIDAGVDSDDSPIGTTDAVPELQVHAQIAMAPTTGTNGFQADVNLGLVHGRVSDGTTPELQVTAANPISDKVAKLIGSDLTTKHNFNGSFTIRGIRSDGTADQTTLEYSDGDVTLLEFLAGINTNLPTGVGEVAGLSVGKASGNRLVISSRSQDYVALEVIDGEAYGFALGGPEGDRQYEDSRSRGLGFTNGQSVSVDGSTSAALTADVQAPANGQVLSDSRFQLNIEGQKSGGGKRSVELPVEISEALDGDSIESLNDLAEEVERQLREAADAVSNVRPDRISVMTSAGALKIVVADGFFTNANSLKLQVAFDELDRTRVTFDFSVDFVDPSFAADDFNIDRQSTYNRLMLPELTSTVLLTSVMQPRVELDGDIRLHIATDADNLSGFAERGLGLANGALGLPEVEFDFKMDPVVRLIHIGDAIIPQKSVGMLLFDDVQVDLGALLESVVVPVANVFGTSMGPVLDVLGTASNASEGFLNKKLPVISDIFGRTDLKDILPGKLTNQLEDLLDGINTVTQLGKRVNNLLKDYDGSKINFGGWIFDPKTRLIVPEEAKAFIPEPNGDSKFELPINKPELPGELNFNSGGMNFDLLTFDSMLNLLTGRPFKIVSYDLPYMKVEGGIDFNFDMHALEFGVDVSGLVRFGGESSGDKLGFAYDSRGLERIADAVKANVKPDYADLLDGFYLKAAPGNDEEFVVKLEASGGGRVDAKVTAFRGSVSADAALKFDIKDPNGDGKLRLDEIFEVTDGFSTARALFGLFDIEVDFGIAADFSGHVGGQEVTADDIGFKPDLNVDFTLGEIVGRADVNSQINNSTKPLLAKKIRRDGQDILRLNVGPFASHRIHGNTDDSDGFTVTAFGDSNSVTVEFGNRSQTYNNIDRVLAVGLDGDDTFLFTELAIPVDVVANGGDDVIKAGTGSDTIDAGPGNDLVRGRDGNDVIDGGSGHDTLSGGLGDDVLEGQSGDDELSGGVGRDQLIGGLGDDLITMGYGDEAVDGGFGTDHLILDETASELNSTLILDADSFLANGLPTAYQRVEQLTMRLAAEARDHLIVNSVDISTEIESGLSSDGSLLELNRAGLTPGDTITVGAGRISLDELAEITFSPEINSLRLTLGAGDDRVTVGALAIPTEVYGNGGNDLITVQHPPAALTVDGGLDSDTVQVQMGNDVRSFAGLGVTTETLQIDGSQLNSEASWETDAQLIRLDGQEILNAAGAGQVRILSGTHVDTLTIGDQTSNPQTIDAQDSHVDHTSGLSVLNPGQSVSFKDLDYSVTVEGLAGPRAIVHSPDGRHVYVADQDDQSVLVFRRASRESLQFVQRLQHGVGAVQGLNSPVAIVISSDGRFVYAANRFAGGGLTMFERRPLTGRLVFRQTVDVSQLGRLTHLTIGSGNLFGAGERADGSASVAFAIRIAADGRIDPTNVDIHQLSRGFYSSVKVGPEGDYLYATRIQENGQDYLDVFKLTAAGNLPAAATSYAASKVKDVVAVGRDVYVAKGGGVARYRRVGAQLQFKELISDWADAVKLHATEDNVVVVYDTSTEERRYDYEYKLQLTEVKILKRQDSDFGDEFKIKVGKDTVISKTGVKKDDTYKIFGAVYRDFGSKTVKVIETDKVGSDDTLGTRVIKTDDYTRQSDGKEKRSFHADNRGADYKVYYEITRDSTQLPLRSRDVRTFSRSAADGTLEEIDSFSGSSLRVLEDVRIVGEDSFYAVDRQQERLVHYSGFTGDDFRAIVPGQTQQLTAQPGAVVSYFSPDGKTAYSISPANGGLIVSDVLNDGTVAGEAKQLMRLDGLTTNSRIAFNATGKRIYVSLPDAHTVAVIDRVNSGSDRGLLTLSSTLVGDAGLLNASALTLSPDGQHLYVAGDGEDAGKLVRYAIAADQTLSYQHTHNMPTSSISSLTFGAGNRLYIGGGASHRIIVASRAAHGNLSVLQTVAGGTGGVQNLTGIGTLQVSADGNFLYAAARSADSIIVFRIAGNGSLQHEQTIRENVAGVRGLSGLVDLSLTADGQYLLAAGRARGSVVVFERDADSGHLQFLQMLQNRTAGLTDLKLPTRIWSTGDRVYVSGPGDAGRGAITSLKIGAPAPTVYRTDFTGVESVILQTGAANDEVKLSDVAADVRVLTGAGDDSVVVDFASANRTTAIELGNGNDFAEVQITRRGSTLTVNGQAGSDEIRLLHVGRLVPEARLIGGTGRDDFYVDGSRLRSAVTVEAGDGVDTMTFNAPAGTTPTNPATPVGDVRNGSRAVTSHEGLENLQIVAAPSAEITDPLPIVEGESVVLDATESNLPAGSGDGVFEWDLNADGVYGDVVGEKITVSWSTLKSFGIDDDGTFPLGLKVSNDVASDTTQTELIVSNVAGNIVLNTASEVEQYSAYVLDFTVADPGNDSVSSIEVNWGDGTVQTFEHGPEISPSHVYRNTGTYSVSIVAYDEDGSSSATTSVSVTPTAAATFRIGGAGAVNEGSTYTLNLQQVIPDQFPLQIDSWVIRWGDGSQTTVPGDATSVQHVFSDNRRFAYWITATLHASTQATADNDSIAVSFPADNKRRVRVRNVKPVADYEIDRTEVLEGESVTLSGVRFNDPGDDTIRKWRVKWGDGNTTEYPAGTESASHVYRDDGTYQVRVIAVDEDGAHADPETTTVTVLNAAPAITLSLLPENVEEEDEDGTGAQPWPREGSSFQLSYSADDPGRDEIYRWVLDWGDGATSDAGVGQTTAPHTYTNDGLRTVTVTAFDEDGSYTTTIDVNVADVMPALQVSGRDFIREGDVLELNLSAVDPGNGLNDEFGEWTIDWGDGASDTFAAGTTLVSHLYEDDIAEAQVTATVLQNGVQHSIVHPLEVLDTAPKMSVEVVDGPPARLQQFRLSVPTDPGNGSDDRFTHYRILWGDHATATDEFGHEIVPPEAYEFFQVGSDDIVVEHEYADGQFTMSVELLAEDGSVYAGSKASVHIVSTDEGQLATAAGHFGSAEVSATDQLAASIGLVTKVTDITGNWIAPWNWSWTSDAPLTESVSVDVNSLSADADVTGTAQFDVIVHNLPPVLANPGNVIVDEGSSAANSGTWSDPGDDEVTLSASVGNVLQNADTTWNWTWNTADGPDDSQTVTITATDSDGASTQTTFDVTVLNVAPTVADSGNVTVDEGSSAANSGTWSDPGDDEVTLSASVGNVVQNADGTWNWSWNTADGPDDSQTVTITATDSDGASTQTTFDLTVLNVAPTVADSGNVTVDEGSSAANSGTWSDPGDDEVTLTASVGNVVQNADGTWNWSWNTADGPDDSQTVTITATDSDGASTQTTFDLTVRNVAPTVDRAEASAAWLQNASADGRVRLYGSFTDPGNDAQKLTVHWGDGATQTFDLAATATSFNVSHQYSHGGLYQIIVTMMDEDGAESLHQTTQAFVQGIGVVDRTLYVIGTDGQDDIRMRPKFRRGQLDVDARLNTRSDRKGSDGGSDVGSDGGSDGGRDRGRNRRRENRGSRIRQAFGVAEFDRVVALLGEGHDRFHAAGDGGSDCGSDGGSDGGRDRRFAKFDYRTLVMGGSGDDRISTGNGQSIVFGGSGRDDVRGGRGADILVGGTERDRLHGGRGDDLLVGGDTATNWEASIDQNAGQALADLDAALAEWSSGRLGDTLNILGGVVDDDERDDLFGGPGRDTVYRGRRDRIRK